MQLETRFYTGIGSRETPSEILKYFIRLGKYFAKQGLVLRSGGAKGADKAFEVGCDSVAGKKEIYLPWKGFEGSNSQFVVNNSKAFEIAEKFHPNWQRLSIGAQKLQARNTHQVLGWDLKTPTDFIICWTKNGSGEGGTGQALRIANTYNIPIFDAGKYKDIEDIKVAIKDFLQTKK